MQGGKGIAAPSLPLRGLPLAVNAGLGAAALVLCFVGEALHSWPLLVLYGLIWGVIMLLLDARLRAKGLWKQAIIGALAANGVAWLAWWLWPQR